MPLVFRTDKVSPTDCTGEAKVHILFQPRRIGEAAAETLSFGLMWFLGSVQGADLCRDQLTVAMSQQKGSP